MYSVTINNDVVGIYPDEASAYFFATINFGFEGWTVTRTDEITM